MTPSSEQTFLTVALTHFVPCFFVGAILLLAAKGTGLPDVFPKDVAGELARSALNGLAVAGLIAAFHLRRNQTARRNATDRATVSRSFIRRAALAGFLAGAADVLLTTGIWTILALTAIIWTILIWNLRTFIRHAGDMLRPGSVITWGDVGELLRIYLTTLIGFTLVNAALDGLHVLAGAEPAFSFNGNGDGFVNALYFTVVTMTTLGFGDIVPRTWDAKWLLIVQSLLSYFMFALMVGIITRGVTGRTRPDKE
ncbi:potassium channel family protein [Pseudodesulfovibrio indicus]|uniref:potassium channel family protein n=1 Tax=Pseudodesulfovibrio indicus TaxID=1716143 RepID=UPI002930AA56|nr:potassium channel family protein [Pseudodesulfovibrio indicus]